MSDSREALSECYAVCLCLCRKPENHPQILILPHSPYPTSHQSSGQVLLKSVSSPFLLLCWLISFFITQFNFAQNHPLSPPPTSHHSGRAFPWRVEFSVETLVPNIPSHLPLAFCLPLSSSAYFMFMSPCPRVSLTLLTFLLHSQLSLK